MTKGELKRQKIIEAAIKEFSKEGFYSVSVQRIADKAKVSQANVFQHFGSKNGLLKALRLHTTEKIHTFVDKKMTPKMTAWERLEAYMLYTLEWVLANRDLSQLIILNYYFSCFDADFKKHIVESVDRAENRLNEFLYACQREGFIEESKSVPFLSTSIHNFLFGYSIKLLGSKKAAKLNDQIKKQSLNFLKEII